MIHIKLTRDLITTLLFFCGRTYICSLRGMYRISWCKLVDSNWCIEFHPFFLGDVDSDPRREKWSSNSTAFSELAWFFDLQGHCRTSQRSKSIHFSCRASISIPRKLSGKWIIEFDSISLSCVDFDTQEKWSEKWMIEFDSLFLSCVDFDSRKNGEKTYDRIRFTFLSMRRFRSPLKMQKIKSIEFDSVFVDFDGTQEWCRRIRLHFPLYS